MEDVPVQSHSPLRILITGGTGFIGKRIARHLLNAGLFQLEGEAPREIAKIILFDAFPGEDVPTDARIEVRIGDIDDRETVVEITRDVDLVWHLAAVVSSAAEADFDLGMQVNLYGLLNLLEALRARTTRTRLVYASGFAVFGGELPPVVTDATAPAPKSSYGIQKAIGELLVADYSRRGFVDGRTLRLPTITVRPGKPNKAASTFVSSIIREPLNGHRAVCPVRPDTIVYISSPRRALDAMLHAMHLDDATIGAERTLPLPGLTVSVAGMVESLARAGGVEAAGLIDWVPDAQVQRIVESWPTHVEAARASALGFHADPDFDAIVRAHIEDEAVPVARTADPRGAPE
jgi:nucleoside-diphosphate-sugar epimerase